MKIKYLVSMAGAPDRHPGDVADVDADEAGRLIEAGYAEATTDAPVSRAPTATAPEIDAMPDVETAQADHADVETAAGRGKRAPRKAVSE